ncbi:unnamed protein product (macronuclear) [Paramecium tetraurelia]|uniref:Syntaxin N-terminal domain-containing protein n=1 Tax=Paramecium tetraurelia TaxID=5888 RepID=A0BNA4_PARTE|nr:uncharacterized protein GSPATT00030659001 [Paramecium tetraurelia]CAK60021.1 unnamed protein product [Paramecium tetraurelia]|eukprot:XP_001427419.1 hypothetical protein (macronuclear) [Paramecium tetraurelia strain d4-2]
MKKEQDDQERQPILIEKDNQYFDWESFKKQYYQQENVLQTTLKSLNELHSEISRKLIQLDKSDPICEEDEQENRKQFQSIDVRKYQDQFDDLNLTMSTMSRMLNQYAISPEEVQAKLKNNMLRRFKEIHQEHEKEVLKLKQAIKTNTQKYELFKEAIKNQSTTGNQKYKRDYQLNDFLSRGVNQASHVLDMASTIHSSLEDQGYRVSSIQNKVTDYMGTQSFYAQANLKESTH